MWEGLKLLHEKFGNSQEVEVESDALDLIRCLNKEDDNLMEIKNIVEAIKDLAPKLGVLSFKHCPRSHNGAAHSIAREGAFCSSGSCFFCRGTRNSFHAGRLLPLIFLFGYPP